MRIQLISADNGYGLSKDIAVMRTALEPRHEVHFTPWGKPRNVAKGFYGANIFLEILNAAHFPSAQTNYLIPNPEWFTSSWIRDLPRLDSVLCKTRDAESIFSKLGARAQFIGFTSPDNRIVGSQLRIAVLHIAGASTAKGTPEVIAAARLLPAVDFTIVSKVKRDVPSNVRLITDRLADEAMMSLMNSHAIHACPSTYEGFGHTTNEARSVGACLITTAAAPMMELATSDFAFGVEVCREVPSANRLAVHHHVCVDRLAEAISCAEQLPTAVLGSIAVATRAAYVKDRAEFTERINVLFP